MKKILTITAIVIISSVFIYASAYKNTDFVPSKSVYFPINADFSGEITGFETRPQVIQANDNAASERITVTVKVKFTNSAEPKMSYDESFSRYRDYTSPADMEQKLPEIYDELIEDIFNKAFVNW